MSSLADSLIERTLLISGGSRGIGLAIAIAAARHGSNVVLLAKTAEPHPRLCGTVFTAVAEIEAVGGKAAAVVGDVRREEDVQRAVETAVERFGGVDICVNNASAISTEPTEQLGAKRFDLMMDVNVRGAFLMTKACIPHLRVASNPHVLTVSPPINLNPYWLGVHPAYTLSKYGMTMLSLGWAREYADAGIAVNCLWPQTYINTDAVANMADGDKLRASSRSPEIMADAAIHIISQPATRASGNCYIDADVLTGSGVTDLSTYGGGECPMPDLFLD